RRLTIDSRTHRWRARDRRRTTVQSAPSPRTRRVRFRGMGAVREQPPGEVLLPDSGRPSATQSRRVGLASLRRRVLQSVGPDGKRLFRLPWRTSRQIRRDVDDELRFHIDTRIDALVADGLTPDAARARAMREFGDIEDARRYIGAVD